MPVETLEDLKLLFRKYNVLISESRDLENNLDKVEPYPGYRLKRMELQKLTSEMNETISLIKETGYAPSEKELITGFVI